MIKKMGKISVAGLMFLTILSFSGCANTWKGVGEDVEKIGKKMQRNVG